jgi:hypothetical protein
MAQLTGIQIGYKARIWAQDTDPIDPAVNSDEELSLLNDVLLRFTGDVESKELLVSATTSGLTFAANTAVATTSASDLYDHILAAYPSDSASVPTVLPPGLTLWTVKEMLDAYNNDGSGTVTGSGTREWQAYAWERVAGSTADTGSTSIRVYVYPALAATRYLTLRVPKNVMISSLAATPDLSIREAHIVARLLAWEMARLHQRDGEFLQQILAPLPNGILDRYFEAAKTHGWMQAAPAYTGALDG